MPPSSYYHPPQFYIPKNSCGKPVCEIKKPIVVSPYLDMSRPIALEPDYRKWIKQII